MTDFTLRNTPIQSGDFKVTVRLMDGTVLQNLSTSVISWSYSEEPDEESEEDYGVTYHLQLDHLVTYDVLQEIKTAYSKDADGETEVFIEYHVQSQVMFTHYFKGIAGFPTDVEGVREGGAINYHLVVICSEVDLHRLA